MTVTLLPVRRAVGETVAIAAQALCAIMALIVPRAPPKQDEP
jgi:hypothetical protein